MAKKSNKSVNIFNVIDKPCLSEKSKKINSDGLNTLVIYVNKNSNKGDISRAVFMSFGVKPLTVRTLLRKGKLKRAPRTRDEYTCSDKKKAYVVLSEDDFKKLTGDVGTKAMVQNQTLAEDKSGDIDFSKVAV